MFASVSNKSLVGELGYSSTHSKPPHDVEAGGQLHASVALPPRKALPTPIE